MGNSNSISVPSPSAQKSPEVFCQMDALQILLDSLYSQVGTLEKKLEPIVYSTPEAASNASLYKELDASTLASSIRAKSNQLEEINNRLSYLISHMEI